MCRHVGRDYKGELHVWVELIYPSKVRHAVVVLHKFSVSRLRPYDSVSQKVFHFSRRVWAHDQVSFTGVLVEPAVGFIRGSRPLLVAFELELPLLLVLLFAFG